MEALGLDIKLLIAQTVNFLLFVFLFKKFLYVPFRVYLRKERQEEVERDRLLKNLQDREEKMSIKEKDIIADARSQAIAIIKEAEDEAAKKRRDLLTAAQQEASEMKRKAEQDMADEKERLYDEVKSHVVRTSEVLTQSVLTDFVDESKQKAMLETIFDKLRKSKVYEN